eukprot:gene24920-32475_t
MIRIGTRSSPLALIQAKMVHDALTRVHPEKRIQIIPFTTKGDRTTQSLRDIGGKALFTKELQDALLNGTIDGAVHSLKDVELHDLPLVLGAHLPREAAHDVLITRKNTNSCDTASGVVDDIFKGTLGTCSPRRRAQSQLAFPQFNCVDLRGNVNTRLKHVVDGTVDATILAAAGLARLNLQGSDFDCAYPLLQQRALPVDTFIPSAGQGVIVVECKPVDAHLFEAINDPWSEYCSALERHFSKRLGGSCRTALGAYVREANDNSKDPKLLGKIEEAVHAKGKAIEILAFFEGRTQRRQLHLPVTFKKNKENNTEILKIIDEMVQALTI